MSRRPWCEKKSQEFVKIRATFHLSSCFFFHRRDKTCLYVCLHTWMHAHYFWWWQKTSLVKGCISYMFCSAFSQQLMPAFVLSDVATSRSRPPHCKLKQMSDEGKRLVLHNEGALPREHCDVAPELTDVQSNCSKCDYFKAERLKCSQVCTNMNHLMEIINNMDDKQSVIRAAAEKEEHFILVRQIHGLTKRPSDNREEEKHTRTKKEKESKEPQTQADQQTRGRLYVYDPALPPRPLLHTHVHTTHAACWNRKPLELRRGARKPWWQPV